MSNLQHRTTIIQEKRKKTPRRQFVMEICSWYTMVINKNKSKFSRFPETDRVHSIYSVKDFEEVRGEKSGSYTGSFMQDFELLFKQSPLPGLMHWGENENCEYSDIVAGAKNAYLSFTLVADVENIVYGRSIKNNSKNVLNSMMVRKNCDVVYQSSCVLLSTNIFYSSVIQNSFNLWFCSDCIGCTECIDCYGLINQSYCIHNKKLSKDEYFLEKAKILSKKEYFKQSFSKLGTHGVLQSTDVSQCYYINQTHHARNTILYGSAQDNENVYDVFIAGSPYGNDIYGGVSIAGNHIYICDHILGSENIFYSYFLENCSFCLGCIGLKNKSYCILNKQYTKEERYEKVDEIFSQMEKDGTLGEFFPPSMNPFYFNDTAAYLIDPTFTKEEVTAKGYLRRDEPIKVDIPSDAQVVKYIDLDQFESFDINGNRTINPDILKKVIQDDHGNYYRIIPMEYKFLMKYGLPLPRKHWLERMKENFRIN